MTQKKNRKRKASGSSGAKTASPTSFKGAGWLLAAALVGAYFYFSGERSAPEAVGTPPAAAQTTDAALPAFHRDPETAKPFPALLPSTRYDHPVVSRAYAIAHEIPEVLAQQPCYCYCDKFGHGSLLDCWASDHGAG